ncbi:unnamed protein product [Brassica napus]|uniref:(rape) hypothetical protein n=1 Tax=Brassica napus TaxID=3708 RepID=A0A816LLS4_BRANA|nr:unnamed protein product [Brassica napus]
MLRLIERVHTKKKSKSNQYQAQCVGNKNLSAQG